jgi:hypothetical protein
MSKVVSAEVGAPGEAETMLEYVVRRAAEVKQYKRVADDTGVGYSWLTKLAQGRIPKPNYGDIETLFFYYKALELGVPLPLPRAETAVLE